MERQKKAYLFAVLAVLLWSTAASAFKITLRYISPFEIIFISTFVSAVFFALVIIVQGKLKQIFETSGKKILLSMLMGLFNPFIYYLILFKAYSILPAHQAQPLNFIWPIVIVLISIPILKQKITLRNIVAILVSFIGVIIISTRANFNLFRIEEPLGVFLALVSSVFWALFFVINIRDNRDEMVKLGFSFFFGFCYILIFMIIRNDWQLPAWQGIIGSVYIGCFEMGITFFVWMMALKLSHTTAHVSNLIYLTPFISLIFIRLVVREAIHYSAIIGLFFIIGGILLQPRSRY
jgi:drug/metabolite transporter (DMT)-like permease